MDSAYTHPRGSSITALIESLDNKHIVLPEFQRNFTWDLERTVDLFDSLVKDIFIGALILAKPDFDLSCRGIDKRPRKGEGSRARVNHDDISGKRFQNEDIYVLLDGQQRATSLYRALNGVDKIYFVFKSYNKLPKSHKDVSSIVDIVDYFDVKPHKNEFSISVSDVYKSKELMPDELSEEVYTPLAKGYKYIYEDETLRKQYLNLTAKLIKDFNSLLNDKTLLSVFLLDMDLDKFTMFFERSNSRGIALNFIDIITAKIYKDFKLGKAKDTYAADYNDYSLNDSKNVEALVRYLSFLKTGEVDKKTILKELDGNFFKQRWDEVTKLYFDAKNILVTQRYLYKIDNIPYKTLLIPIMHFLNCLPSKDFSQASVTQKDFFEYWYWSSLFNVRYGGGSIGSTNDIIRDDCELLEKVAQLTPISEDTINRLKVKIDYDDLLDVTADKGAIACGIFSYMHFRNEIKELRNNGKIDFNNEINFHHIFPKNYVENKFGENSKEYSEINTILNKIIIGKISNIKFGNKAPSTYLNEDPINNNSKLTETLQSHLINSGLQLVSGKLDNDFFEFLQLRYETFKELIFDQLEKDRLNLLSRYPIS